MVPVSYRAAILHSQGLDSFFERKKNMQFVRLTRPAMKKALVKFILHRRVSPDADLGPSEKKLWVFFFRSVQIGEVAEGPQFLTSRQETFLSAIPCVSCQCVTLDEMKWMKIYCSGESNSRSCHIRGGICLGQSQLHSSKNIDLDAPML